ncbi:MAG: hypothetical protein QW746_05330 [Thermoplasmata archaeon]
MIYKNMEIFNINYDKVSKSFQALVDYPLSNPSHILINVKWREGDTEWTFTERIYQGAVMYMNLVEWLKKEDIVVRNILVYPENKEEYYFVVKVGSIEKNKSSYLYTKTSDNETIIRQKVQSIKTSFSTKTISEKRKEFFKNFKSFLGG